MPFALNSDMITVPVKSVEYSYMTVKLKANSTVVGRAGDIYGICGRA